MEVWTNRQTEKQHKTKSTTEHEIVENDKYINAGTKQQFNHREIMHNKRNGIEGTDILARGGQVCGDRVAVV
jgi:hypothetical protein